MSQNNIFPSKIRTQAAVNSHINKQLICSGDTTHQLKMLTM